MVVKNNSMEFAVIEPGTQDFWHTPKLPCQMVGTKQRACVFLKISNMINLQTNTTEVVIMSLPNDHQKEFVIHQNFFQLFNPSVHQNPFFSPFVPSSEVITHWMEWNALKSNALIHPTPQHVLFIYHATQPKKHTCHHVPKQCFHLMTPQNDPNFHLTMLHKNPIHVAMRHWNLTSSLGIYLEQIVCFITNHANITRT